MVLVGLLRWYACMLREHHSEVLLYKSYRLVKCTCGTHVFTRQ
jgi:hypothetical protein